MAEKIEVAKLELNVEALLQATANVKDNILYLREQQTLLRKEGQETSLQYIKNAAEIKKLSKEYNSLEKAVVSQISVTGQMITKEEALENALKSENVTIQNAIDNNSELRAIKRNLNLTTEEGQKTLEKINKKIDENTNFVKENGDAYEKQKMEIGNYKNNIVDAAHELNIFNGGLLGFMQRAQAAGGVAPFVTSSFKTIATGIKGMTKASLAFIATPIGATIAALAGIALATKEWFKYNREVVKANRETEAITKLSGQALDDARVKAKSLAKTFDVDFKQVLEGARSLVNSFEITYTEALERIEEGLIKGGAASDEYLNSIKEYSIFFEQAGYSVEEFNSLINTGIDLGIYKDKLPDAIKEFGLSVSEQTESSRKAMENAFGRDFTDKLLDGIKKGTITAKQALIEMSEEAKRVGLNAQQSQQLTADLFRGAGEDAGGAIKIFEAVSKSIENQKRPLSEVEQATKDLADAQNETAKSKERLLKSDGFDVWEKNVSKSIENIKRGFYDLLFIITNSREELEKLYETEAEDEAIRRYGEDSITYFEDYIERRKKSLGDAYTFERVQQEYLQSLQQSYNNASVKSTKDRFGAAIEAVENYRDKSIQFNEEIANDELINLNRQKARLEAQGKDTFAIEEKILLTRMSLLRKSSQEYIDLENELFALRTAKSEEYLDDYAKELQLELDMFIGLQEGKSKSLQAEIDEAEKVKNDKLKIAEAEYKASERTANDELELEIKKQTAIREYAQATSEITKSFATAELDLFIQQNQSKLDNAKLLTDELYKEEEKRLQAIKDRQLQQLALEKNTDLQTIEQKKANNEALSLNDIEYLSGKAAIENEYNIAIDKNNTDFKNYVKKRDADQALIDKEIKLAEAKSEYEKQLIEEDFRHKQEMIRLQEQLNEKKITVKQFEIFKRAESEKTEAIQTKLAFQKQAAELDAYSKIAGAISEMFGQNKALALAMAGIDGAKAITSILAQYPKFDGGIAMWAAVAAATVTTASQVRKISSTKPPKEPKFEKGGALSVLGGNRHAQGGVKFQGSDGTRFEAEQGEIIGVMNRNAASHFLAFNSLFNSGMSTISKPSYFANGGGISVANGPGIDVDELALKLAEANRNLPAPVVMVQDVMSETAKTVNVQSQANY